MQISDEKYGKADEKLLHISLSADNLECVAAGLDERLGRESFEANAVHFIAQYLSREIRNVQETLFGCSEAL